MDQSELKIKLEELGVPDDLIEEAIHRSVVNGDEVHNYHRATREEIIGDLVNSLLHEKDWRKRASIAARIISYNLER